MFFEKLYNLIYHIGFTAGSGFMKFGKWLSRGLSGAFQTVGAVFFTFFLVIDAVTQDLQNRKRGIQAPYGRYKKSQLRLKFPYPYR